MVIIPAHNEECAIRRVIESVRVAVPGAEVLVIDDLSTDGTVTAVAGTGATTLQLPIRLGLGGAVQAGYKLAFEAGYDYVVRVDGDGQHEPREIPKVLERLQSGGAEVVIGSRYLEPGAQYSSLPRRLGIIFFRLLLWPILGRTIYDPTSGFIGVNRRALAVLSRTFPLDYPEVELLVVLQRRRFRFEEIPARMHPRTTGYSKLDLSTSFTYMTHVLLGVFVNVLRFDGRVGRGYR